MSKHKILRTSLIFDHNDGTLRQCITNNHQLFSLVNKQIVQNKDDIFHIIYEITINPTLFDFSSGRVFHCQILQQEKIINQNQNQNDNELVTDSDILIMAFHHAAFDRATFQIFFKDLSIAYNTNAVWSNEEESSLQYIDYAAHERIMDMTSTRDFWRSQLEGYNFERPLSLPVDRHRLSHNQHSGFASLAYMSLDDENSTAFFDYASLHQVTPFQLGLAIFYAFLFKLTYGQKDFCLSSLNANRYRTELQNIIGMFVATLPYRMQFDSHWSFDELVKHVREKCLSILEHSHYPLQKILIDSHLNLSNGSILETAFDFVTVSLNVNQLAFDGATLEQVPLEETSVMTKFDLMLTFVYNPTVNDRRLAFRLVGARDLFEETTAITLAQRLKHLFQQLFSSKSNVIQSDTCAAPISKLNLILPKEVIELQNPIFFRQSNVMNESMSIYLLMQIILIVDVYILS